MSTTKFTPKPMKCVAMEFGDGENAGLVAFWMDMEEPCLLAAYAHLVNASGEMYESLKEMRELVSGFGGGGCKAMVKRADIALAKADGAQ